MASPTIWEQHGGAQEIAADGRTEDPAHSW